MPFPLISSELISILRLVHGLFNFIIMLLLFYHTFNGLLIRRARRGKTPLPIHAIKLHRRMGPVLALFGGAGFSAGLILIMLDTGKVLQYPTHLFVGVVIVIMLFSTYRISRKIAGSSIPQRNLHYKLGCVILALYLVNVVIGIGVLL
ncbi:MAG: DUF4079 family protein [Desulfuromonadaceae bacterium]|nr:DUF4079 family protein [Desulfuromonadaceae bacterium]